MFWLYDDGSVMLVLCVVDSIVFVLFIEKVLFDFVRCIVYVWMFIVVVCCGVLVVFVVGLIVLVRLKFFW